MANGNGNGNGNGSNEAQKSKAYVPSKYQQAIFYWIANGKGSAIVEAVAGSGKTTTVVDALRVIPSGQSCIFLAFNKSIATELQNRVPAGTVASTFHSAGYRTWSQRNRNCQLDDRKVSRITMDRLDYRQNKAYGKYVVQLVSLAKQTGVGCIVPDNYGIWRDLSDHFDLCIDNPDREDNHDDLESEAIDAARSILKESSRMSGRVIDYNDMLYMPVLEDLPLRQFDWVFVDEAQDTNNVRRALAAKMLKPNGRLVAVGDSHQAIYGFTGANSDAMGLMRDEFGCTTFPLSVSYRCAKAIVDAARVHVPSIESHKTAPDGYVGITDFKTVPPRSTDAILCRNTAPLVSLAYHLIRSGVGCKIQGSDIGKGIIAIVEKMQAEDLKELGTKLGEYCRIEVERLVEREQEGRAQAVVDRAECVYAVMEGLGPDKRTIVDLMDAISAIFGDNINGLLTLSTVHKAKGMEWDRVYIYRPELMPCCWAEQDWQVEQEDNLQYVAITRAKKELYYVDEVGVK